jgi:hypothetical protein
MEGIESARGGNEEGSILFRFSLQAQPLMTRMKMTAATARTEQPYPTAAAGGPSGQTGKKTSTKKLKEQKGPALSHLPPASSPGTGRKGPDLKHH